MSKEHPIIFSSPLVRSILEGRKTMTRRIIKKQPPFKVGEIINPGDDVFIKNKWIKSDYYQFRDMSLQCPLVISVKCPYGKIGDLLWVRESGWVDNNFIRGLNEPQLFWKADYENYQEWEKTLIKNNTCRFPSIHMYKEFARIWLEVKNITVERLQDITEEDAIAEGVEQYVYSGRMSFYAYKDYLDGKPESMEDILNAKRSFQSLWHKINGEESWNENPFVWVITFKKIINANPR